MEKWENQIKDRINETLPACVEQRITLALASLPRKKRFTKWKYALLAAVMVIGFLLGASIINPAFAATLKSLPFISTITNLIDDIGMKNGYDKGISIPVQEKYIIKGKEVTFTEVMYDGTAIYLGYLVSHAPLKEQSEILYDLSLNIDNQDFGYMLDYYGELTNDLLYAGRIKIKPVDTDLPDEFTLQLKIDGIGANFLVEKKGTIDIYETTESRRLDDLLINYHSVTFTPTATVISYDEIDRAFNKMIDFIVIDDKGRVLKKLDMSGIGYKDLYEDTDGTKKAIMHDTISVEPLDEKPAYLTLKAYTPIPQEFASDQIIEKWKGEPLTISQGDLGEVFITDVKRDDNVVTVYLTTNGVDEYGQAHMINIQDNDGKRPFDSAVLQTGIHEYKIIFKKFPEKSNVFLTSWQLKDKILLPELDVTIPIESKE